MHASYETSVHLLSAYPKDSENNGIERLLKNSGPLNGYRIENDSERADIIIFVEGHPGMDPYYFRVIRHPLFQKYPEKCVLYHDADRSVTQARTITPCIPKGWASPSTKKGFHYIVCPRENKYIKAVEDFDHPRDYLYSFDGASNRHATRKAIMQLKHPDGLLIDRGGTRIWTLDEKKLSEFQRSFAESMLRSHFVLCPSGIGPSTYRLFEAMQVARVPVIISDKLIRPEGPNWDEFSITIPERMTHRIPEILEERKHEARAMGLAARKAWQTYFSPEASLQRLCESAAQLVSQPYRMRHRLRDLSNFLRPDQFRGLCRYYLRHRKHLKTLPVPENNFRDQSPPSPRPG